MQASHEDVRIATLARRLLRPWVAVVAMLCVLIGWGVSQFSRESVRAHLAEIEAEATARPGAPDWAGMYSRGAITPIVVGMAPDAGYQYAAYACRGMADAARGAVDVEGTRVHLGPAWPFFWRNWDFELVHWGERRYLIEPERLPEFVAYVNQGSEPRETLSGLFFLKCANPRLLPLGQPRLPPEFARQLLPRIEGHVLAATRRADAQELWELELDLGSARGASAARRIWTAASDSQGFASGELTEVSERTSRAVVEPAEFGPPPAIGWCAALGLGP